MPSSGRRAPGHDLIARYDREERRRPFAAGPGCVLEWDGPVFRLTGPDPQPWSNAVLFTDLGDAPDTEIEAVIERQLVHFRARGHGCEWKVFDHDRPADLGERLRRRGLVPETPEVVVALDLERPFAAPPLPGGYRVERLDDPAAFDVVGHVSAAVNGDPVHARWLVRSLRDENDAAPGRLAVYVARGPDDAPVACGWLRLPEETSFASLWGGSTLAAHRRRGLYTALVAERVARAREHGFAHATVDCGPQSLPILLARGFERLCRVTPWVLAPPAGPAA